MSTITLYDNLNKLTSNEHYMSNFYDDLAIVTGGTRDKKPKISWPFSEPSPWNVPISSPPIADDTSWNAWATFDEDMPSESPISIDIGNDTIIDDKLYGELYKIFNFAMPDGTFKSVKYSDGGAAPKMGLSDQPVPNINFPSDLLSKEQLEAMIASAKAYYPVGKDIYPATMVDSYKESYFKPRIKTDKLNMQPMFNAAKEAFLILDAVYEQVVIAGENRPYWQTDSKSLIDMRPLAMRAHRITKINIGIESPGVSIDTELFEDFMLIREEDRIAEQDIADLVSAAVNNALEPTTLGMLMTDVWGGPHRRVSLELLYDGALYSYRTGLHGEFSLVTLLRDPSMDRSITQLKITRYGDKVCQYLTGGPAIDYLKKIPKGLIELPYGIRT